MASSRSTVKMEAGSSLSANQMSGGGGGGQKSASVKQEEGGVKKGNTIISHIHVILLISGAIEEGPVGSFYEEDDRLDNGDPNQYRPMLMPFPDIRGEEVHYNEEEAEQELQRWKLDPNDTTVDEPKYMGAKPKPCK
jgi:hypothetical protein